MRRQRWLAMGTSQREMVGFTISLFSVKSQCPCQLGSTLANRSWAAGPWSWMKSMNPWKTSSHLMAAESLEGSADLIPALSLLCRSANRRYPFKMDGALLWGLLKSLEIIKELCQPCPSQPSLTALQLPDVWAAVQWGQLPPASPWPYRAGVQCSSGAPVGQHELPGHGGALLLVGDALGQSWARWASTLRGVSSPLARQGCGGLMAGAVLGVKTKFLQCGDASSAWASSVTVSHLKGDADYTEQDVPCWARACLHRHLLCGCPKTQKSKAVSCGRGQLILSKDPKLESLFFMAQRRFPAPGPRGLGVGDAAHPAVTGRSWGAWALHGTHPFAVTLEGDGPQGTPGPSRQEGGTVQAALLDPRDVSQGCHKQGGNSRVFPWQALEWQTCRWATCLSQAASVVNHRAEHPPWCSVHSFTRAACHHDAPCKASQEHLAGLSLLSELVTFRGCNTLSSSVALCGPAMLPRDFAAPTVWDQQDHRSLWPPPSLAAQC